MTPTTPAVDIDLAAYLIILRRRKWIIIGSTLLILAVALFTTYQKTPRYHASASLYVGQSKEASFVDPFKNNGYIDASRGLANDISILEGENVRQLAATQLGYNAAVSATASSTNDVLTLTATDVDPKRAARTVNAYAKAYIAYRETSGKGDVGVVSGQLTTEINSQQAELDPLNNEIAQASPADRAAVTERLAARRNPLLTQLSTLREQLAQLQLGANLTTPAQLLSSAQVPRHPFDPKPRRVALVAFAAGLGFGLGLAVLIDYLDDSVKSQEDVAKATHGLISLGVIPAFAATRKGTPGLTSIVEPSSSAAEAYRSLRTSIQVLSLDSPPQLIQVTSASASEGKSTTVANLAVALARAGQRVILVDADLRRPRVGAYFGIDNSVGLTSVLLHQVELADALKTVEGEDLLQIMTSGPVPPNPSELLSSFRMIEVLEQLRAQASLVLFDSPPLLPVTDAAVLSGIVDATVLVVSVGLSGQKQLTRAITVLRQLDAKVVGTVLNRVSDSTGYGYGYRYSYKPYSEEPGHWWNKKKPLTPKTSDLGWDAETVVKDPAGRP